MRARMVCLIKVAAALDKCNYKTTNGRSLRGEEDVGR